MNREMRVKLGVDPDIIIGSQLDNLLTTGSKIFLQTHFYPLIKMQKRAREIYLSFKSINGDLPVLLNIEGVDIEGGMEFHCSGMEISKRNQFEKELLEAKRTAEEALAQNAELVKVKTDLLQNEQILEAQYRKLRIFKEQQQELYKLIAHDLQEPLRKSVFFSNLLLSRNSDLSADLVEKLMKIIKFNSQMRQMLSTLQRFEQFENAELKITEVALPEIISEAMKQTGFLEDENKVSVTYSASSPTFYADRNMLQSLFVELMRNSQERQNSENEQLTIEITAVETQKNIFIEYAGNYKYEKFVKITFVDNGLGFDDDSSKIFKIIQRSEQFNKISIGLAFCKRIVEKHHGTILAKSVKGKGVGYTIFLPLKPAES